MGAAQPWCDGIESGGALPREYADVERAFNVLAQPDLRASYDALLIDPGGLPLSALINSD
jgi:hypothetical protein